MRPCPAPGQIAGVTQHEAYRHKMRTAIQNVVECQQVLHATNSNGQW